MSLAYLTHAHIFVRQLGDVHLLSHMLVLTLFGKVSGKISKGTVIVYCDTLGIQLGYSEDTVKIQWGYSRDTVRVQWGYREGIVWIQWGYSGDTVRIQWGYSMDTVRIQRRYKKDTVRIQWGYSVHFMRNQRYRHLEFDKDNVLPCIESLVTVYVSYV